LQQALRIIAVDFVERPAAAEIDAGGRHPGELLARARGNTQYRQEHDESHAPIL
jgi:hypothetical protein